MKTAPERWAKHVEHALGKRDNGALYSALRKYGPDSFSLEVLVVSDDWESLCELEKRAIQEYKSLSPNGYNIALGGEGVQGKRSDKDRRKIAEAQKKRFSDPSQRALMSEFSRRSRLSPKWIASCVARRKTEKPKMSREEWHRRLVAALNKPETKSKIRECAKRRSSDPGWRSKISASKKGKVIGPCSEKRKRLISEARKREWKDPKMRQIRLVALAKARAAKANHETFQNQ